MYVRLTFCKFLPDSINDAKTIYTQEVIPVVKQQKGNIGIYLLEPAEKADDFISLTEWETKADAEAYERSGVYKEMLQMLESFFGKSPLLKSYSTEGILMRTPEV